MYLLKNKIQMFIVIVAGAAGQGKSTTVNNTYLKNNVRQNPINPLKNLYSPRQDSVNQYIFDVNNEYEFPTDTQMFGGKFRHIDCDINRYLDNVSRLRNHNIVIEDATGFLRGRQSAKFARLMVQRIHSQNNYFIFFHSINRIPPEIFEMANYCILFKTNDSPDYLEKFKHEKLTSAYNRLKNAPDKSHELIKLI